MKKVLYLFMFSGICAGLMSLESCQSSKKLTAPKILKFNFENGKVYEYEINQSMNQEIMGMQTKINASTFFSLEVVENDDSLKTMRVTYSRIKMKMDVSSMHLDLDTDNPKQNADKNDDDSSPTDKLSKIMSSIKGKQFMIKVNPEGKILALTGFDKISKSISDSMKLKGEEAQQMTEEFNQQFNGESTRFQLENVLNIYPNKVVKVGDSWERNFTSTGLIQGMYHLKYTVKKFDGDNVSISQVGIFNHNEDELGINGKITGDLVISMKSGLVISEDKDLTITMETGGQTFDIKGKVTINGKEL
ncbi:MAG: DUF6263 family protein [Chitinophagaceae bacterium]